MERKRALRYAQSKLPLRVPFRISDRTFYSISVLTAEIRGPYAAGRGEAAGVYYLDDTVEKMPITLEYAREAIESATTRHELRTLLPPGGARNALDCAMWELEAREAGRPVWALATNRAPVPLTTLITLGVDSPAALVSRAAELRHAKALKLKLDGDLDADIERVRAVRKVRRDAMLVLDANQAYLPNTFDGLLATLADCGVAVLEQPFPRGRDADLELYNCPVRLAADESFQSLEDFDAILGRYDIINVKLDKCGGLTEALMIADRARQLDLQLMVGNMLGSSLAMAPAFIFGQRCDVVDLDGPLFLSVDRVPGVRYESGNIECSDAVWGG